ncbi:MAG: DUF503 domain-containing protein [Candidatus Omnitrophica bacterium]|nr:DUF503 domain-containing protein [Candidatus Omnitrophota bacterium]
MMMDITIHIGLLQISVFIPEAHSLKEKRMVLKRLKDKIRNKFNVSIAELDQMDKWQTAVIGITIVSNDIRYIDKTLQHVKSFIEAYHALEITDHVIEFF